MIPAPSNREFLFITLFPNFSAPGAGTYHFGPYSNVPRSESLDTATHYLRLHFLHNEHQGYLEHVKREIEVSHWGNVAFKENYKLLHGGAKLTGEFNRIPFTWQEYRRRGMAHAPQNPVLTGLEELSVVLPRTARNLHYRDE